MAHLHGLAGQWAKDQAKRRFGRMFIVSLIFMGVCGTGLGLFLGLGFTLWASVVFALTTVSAWAANSLIQKPLDQLARERIKYLRGGQAEALVAWLLKDLNDQWHIFNGVCLESARDIDHVVVGPGGVFVISTKSYRGLFQLVPDGRVFYNNQPTGLIGDTHAQAMRLKDRLAALLGGDVPYVTAVLAVPLAYVDFQGPQRGVWVLHQEDLPAVLENAGNRLPLEQVARCVMAIEMLASSAVAIYQHPVSSQGCATGTTTEGA